MGTQKRRFFATSLAALTVWVTRAMIIGLCLDAQTVTMLLMAGYRMNGGLVSWRKLTCRLCTLLIGNG